MIEGFGVGEEGASLEILELSNSAATGKWSWGYGMM